MSVAHDIYSETNPAFCAIVLQAFTVAYSSANAEGPEVPTVYLALPVALSGDLGRCFEGTNKNTGLLEWLGRQPRIHVGLADRVNASMNIVTDAIRFGCFTGILFVDSEARLRSLKQGVKNSTSNALSDSPLQMIKRAERLGYWFGSAGSTRNIFSMMGLTV